MRSVVTVSLVVPAVLGAAVAIGSAQTAPSGIVPPSGGATFAFTTSVQTPKGTHSGSGTIVVKRTGPRAVSLTIASDDGRPARTVPLIIGIDGSVAPDPAGSDAAAASAIDPDAKAQAQAFMSEMTVAAHVGIGARKNAGSAAYSVPVTLTPVGTGTPLQSQMTMNGSAIQYIGTTRGETTTQLPAGGSLDPKAIAKTIGVSAFAHAAFGPPGRAMTAIAMRHKRKEEKEAVSGVLPDAVSLTVTAELAGGKIHAVRGAQTDDISLSGKTVTIASSWNFTNVSK